MQKPVKRGTNIGAATPVQIGGNPLLPSDENQQKA